MWSQQVGTANNSCPYGTSNRSFRAIFPKRQTSNWETSKVHQALSSQQQTIEKTNNEYHKMLHSNLRSTFTNTQSGNPLLLNTNGHQVAIQQDFHPNSLFFKGNTTYSQPGVAGHWNQQDIVQTHNGQNNHNQNHRQNGTQHRYSPTNQPPACNVAASQSLRNNNITTNSSVSEQMFPSSNTSQKTQQYPYHQFFSECRMTEPNQNMQSVTMTVSQSYNSNASQSLEFSSGLSLPKNSNVMSETRRSVDLPQQSSVSNNFCVPATADGSGNGHNAANACFKSPSGLSRLKILLENFPPQKKMESEKTELNVANSDSVVALTGMRQFVTVSDGNVHSSPGRIASRAVAVVPPLSQEYYEVASMHTSSNTINQSAAKDNICKVQVQNDCTKYKEAQYFIETSHPYPQIPNYSASTSDSNGSAGHQALDRGSKVATSMQVDQCVAPNAQQSVTSELPVSSNGYKDRSENQTDPNVPVSEVSAATPWTISALTELVQDIEKKAPMMLVGNSTDCSSRELLLNNYWDGDTRNLACKLRTGWYKNLMTDVLEFCYKHVLLDSVILPQENASFKKQPQNYHVLKNDEVYSEQPYKSLWLNISEELNDIDKEFGFPWSLKHPPPIIESHSQPQQFETVNSNPAQLADSGEEEQTSTVEATTTQAASPNKTESESDSSDPYYSFKIQVLPPEEARIIFEQIQSDSHPEKNSLMEVELPKAEEKDVTLNDLTVRNTTVSPIQEVCCISRWLEMICGTDSPDTSECQCKNEQRLKDCTDKTPDEEEKVTCSPSEPFNEPSQISDLTKDNHKPSSHSEPKNNSQISGSKSSTVERKRKRLSSHDSFFPLCKKSDKCNPRDNVNSQPSPNKKALTDDRDPSASNCKTLQLVLFGAARDSCVLTGKRRRCISSSPTVSDGVQIPPKYLSVNLSPSSGKSSETVLIRENTVKRLIYEQWMRSFPPIKIRCRSKVKTQKRAFSSFSGASLRKAEMVESTEIRNQNPKLRLSLTRKRSLRGRLKSEEEKMKMDVIPLKQPAYNKRRTTGNGSDGGRPLQENNVLKFNVLPSTFNFQDRSDEEKEINGSFPNKTVLDEGKDISPSIHFKRERGTWYPKKEKKYCPLRSLPVLKNSSTFHEFQKKYKEKMQPLMKE